MTYSLRSLLVAIAVAALRGTTSATAATASTTSLDGTILTALAGSESAEAPTASAKASDGTLKRGCRDYPVRYKVKHAGEDWLLDLIVRDRSGADVASVSLHGVTSPRKGRTTFSVCRSAVEAGRFTVRGVLTNRDGYDQTEHAVGQHRFWLKRR